MLTETFIASTRAASKNPSNSSLPKDASIFLHDFQPTSTLKGCFNKSITEKNSLVVTQSHVFAAQADGAIVKVFSREKGNLETFVPFHEHISSLACIGPDDGASILVLGTGQGRGDDEGVGGGRLILWELSTGRTIQTPSSHIQPITSLTVDVTGSFILSGSSDSQINVWSIPALLSFTELDEPDRHTNTSPLHTLSNHEGGITALVTGHSHTSVDIAISGSEDKLCNVWDYRAGTLLHTFLMGDTPLCLAIDPADRAFYAGMSDGGVQMVDFHKSYNGVHPLYGQKSTSTPTEVLGSDLWMSIGAKSSPALSIDVSYDGTLVLAGYESGEVLAWDVGAPQNPIPVAKLAQPVTNLTILPPTGFPGESKTRSRLNCSGTRLLNVVKPRPGTLVSRSGASGLYAPEGYTLTACFSESLPLGRFTDDGGKDTLSAEFDWATDPGNPDFPDVLWQAALTELASSSLGPRDVAALGLEEIEDSEQGLGFREEIAQLKARLKVAELQRKSMSENLVEARKEIEKRDKLAEMKRRAKAARRRKQEKDHEKYRKQFMGEEVDEDEDDDDEEMGDGEIDEEDLSDDTEDD